jgi:hypothetical protein
MAESKVLEGHSVAATENCLAGGEVVEVAAQENKDQTLISL